MHFALSGVEPYVSCANITCSYVQWVAADSREQQKSISGSGSGSQKLVKFFVCRCLAQCMLLDECLTLWALGSDNKRQDLWHCISTSIVFCAIGLHPPVVSSLMAKSPYKSQPPASCGWLMWCTEAWPIKHAQSPLGVNRLCFSATDNKELSSSSSGSAHEKSGRVCRVIDHFAVYFKLLPICSR